MLTNPIKNAFINALLADATYVDGLTNEAGIPRTSEQLIGHEPLTKRLTPDLAKYLAEHFEVVAQKLTSDEVTGAIAGSGFDATVWRGKQGTPNAGQIYVSTRGTEGTADFLADADLTTFGLAREQVVDMVNWWLKGRAPVGTMANQIRMAGINDPVYSSGTIVAAVSVPGDGAFSDVTSVVVNGHSLGGHLATAFARLFGGTVSVEAVNTFNSANFNPASGLRFAEFSTALGLGSTQFPSNQTNFYAAHGPDVTTQNITQGQIGQRFSLFNEESSATEWLTVPNHFMFKLTDALALGAALEKLDPNLGLSSLNVLLEAGSHQTKASLERVLDSLLKIIGIEVAALPVGDAGDSADSRKAFHAALAQLQKNTTYKALEGKLKFELTHSAESAKTDFAAFLSLQAGASFSLRLKDAADATSEAQLYAANRAAYEPWLADKTLRNQGGDLTKLNFTDTYLNDRSAYANTLIERNIQDIGGIVPSRQNLRFYDAATDTQILAGAGSSTRSVIAFGDSKNNPLDGGAVADRLYGGAGADTLDGKAGNDYLEGGLGEDTLIGGTGDDILIGGKGNDSYTFDGLFGNDTITDADGQGNITINGASLGSLTQVQNNVWENASKTLVFTQVISAAASAASGGQPVTNLIIGQRTEAGSGSVNATITVNNWKDGDLGISLGTETKKIENNGFVVADRKSKGDEASFFGDSQYWIRSKDTVSGPISLDAGAGNDLIGGSAQAETITGGAGHDWIAGGGGKDVLLGGDGYDWIIADINARPNGGLDENGQYNEPPEGYNNAGIYFDTGDKNKFQGYGWALYTKLDTAGPGSLGVGNGPTDGIVQSGDTSDVFIDGGAGTDNIFGSAGMHYLEIDSKLLRFLPVYMPISFKKQEKKACQTRLIQRLRSKTAGSRSECSIVCYGSRSQSKQNTLLLPRTARALLRKGACA